MPSAEGSTRLCITSQARQAFAGHSGAAGIMEVSGEATNGPEAFDQVADRSPDLILLDYQMPDLNGVDIARQISEMFPQIPMLMVTLHLPKQLAEAARGRECEALAPNRTLARSSKPWMFCCTTRPIFLPAGAQPATGA